MLKILNSPTMYYQVYKSLYISPKLPIPIIWLERHCSKLQLLTITRLCFGKVLFSGKNNGIFGLAHVRLCHVDYLKTGTEGWQKILLT